MKLTPETIKICRESLRITQGQLARRIGISPSLVSAIERQDRELSKAMEQKIRKALNIDDEEITKFLQAYDRINQIAKGI